MKRLKRTIETLQRRADYLTERPSPSPRRAAYENAEIYAIKQAVEILELYREENEGGVSTAELLGAAATRLSERSDAWSLELAKQCRARADVLGGD